VGYRQACAELLKRYEQDKSTTNADYVAWTCVLTADAVADPLVLLQPGLDLGIAHRSTPAHAHATLGPIYYRCGLFEAALHLLQETVKSYQDEQKAYFQLFIAMTQKRLGQSEAARQTLRDAISLMNGPGKTKDPGWEWRVKLRALRQEAEALIKEKGRHDP